MSIVELLFHLIVGMGISVSVGWFHEVLHAYKAVRLGYKVNNMSFRRNETDIEIEEGDPNFRKIAMAPYYVIFPISIMILIAGFYFSFLGLIIAGVALILLHSISIFGEGKDIKELLCDVDEH